MIADGIQDRMDKSARNQLIKFINTMNLKTYTGITARTRKENSRRSIPPNRQGSLNGSNWIRKSYKTIKQKTGERM